MAVLAAVLFGLSTPAAHQLLTVCAPLLLSGLLYLGSGFGLAALGLLEGRRPAALQLQGRDGLTLAAVVVLGGILAPVSLLAGLQSTSASAAALLLNLEGTATLLLAWGLFGEHADAQVVAGALCVLVAGVLLGWPDSADTLPQALAGGPVSGPLLIALACLCWGFDNNLSRGIAHLDTRAIAMWKGLVAGSVNLAIGLSYGAHWPGWPAVGLALLTGFLGYGVSLRAYLRAQTLLGTARTGAWFSLAPFVGATAALLLLSEAPPRFLWPGAGLMALGLALHLRERHAHWHDHPAEVHGHLHHHDGHHQHGHDFPWDGTEPHSHPHTHHAVRHRHAHFPDLHHRHRHDSAPADQDALD